MAAITFKITKITGKTAEGILTWAAKGLSTTAISGPAGNGYLPAGIYKAHRNKMLDKPTGSSYCDTKGKCWMQPIDPTFVTDRDNLGIHPDGGPAGTEGCIGLKIGDTATWYKAFYDVAAGGDTEIEVINGILLENDELTMVDNHSDIEVEKAIKAAGFEVKEILQNFFSKMGETSSANTSIKLFPNGIGHIKITAKISANINLEFEVADVSYKG